MPPPKEMSRNDLEEQAQVLQRLIDDAQALQKEINDHLKKIRRENQPTGQSPAERRKKPR